MVMDLKKSDVLLELGVGSEVEIIIRKTPPLDFSKKQALPNTRHVISRKLTLLADYDIRMPDKEATVRKQVAQELWDAWIHMNVPPVNIKNIENKLDKLFKLVTKLKNTATAKRGKSWSSEMEKLKVDLDNGFDIRSFHPKSQELLEEDFGIEVGKEEEALYVDNCVPVDGKCKRKAYVTKIDPKWVKEKKKEQDELELEEAKNKKKAEKIANEKKALVDSNAANASTNEKVDQISLDNILGTDESIQRHDSNEFFSPPFNLQQSKVVKPASVQSTSTRASLLNSNQTKPSPSVIFPEIPVRSGYRSLNMDIVEVMVNMECRFKIEQRQVAPCLAYIMNKLAGQKWGLETDEVVETEPVDEDKDANSSKRKRSELGDLTFLLPSRKSLHHRLEDASLMSFKYVAETIQKTNAAGGTVTAGTDDTVKASGHRVHDAKTGRITCVNETKGEDGSTKRGQTDIH